MQEDSKKKACLFGLGRVILSVLSSEWKSTIESPGITTYIYFNISLIPFQTKVLVAICPKVLRGDFSR